MNVPYQLTNESVTVVWKGQTHTVQKGSPNYHGLRAAIIQERWSDIEHHLTAAKSLKAWAKDKFTVNDAGNLAFEGAELPVEINKRALSMANDGLDPTPIFKFWERLQQNPSKRSVDQLWAFLAYGGIPLTEDGCFLAYKGVNSDFTDCHTGTICNKPGSINKMPRNQISDDPNHACHEGFHVGAYEYAGSFGARVIICKVNPADVVCVPYDASHQKMRVSEYLVLGNYGCTLPSTIFIEEPRSTIEHMDDIEEEPEEDEEDEDDEVLAEDTDDEMKEEYDFSGGERGKYAAKEAPVPKAKKKPKSRSSAAKYRKLNKLGMGKLLDQTLDTLRDYAQHGVKIVNSSKIPGGKIGLIKKILETR